MRLYDRLFNSPDPEALGDFIANINPDSRQVLTNRTVGLRDTWAKIKEAS